MALDSGSKKIIVLAIIAIVVLMVVFFLLFTRVFNDSANTDGEQYATFPESGTRSEGNVLPSTVRPVTVSTAPSPEPVAASNQNLDTTGQAGIQAPNQDWRDQIITTDTTASAGTYSPPENTPSSGPSPYTKESLIENGLVLEYPSIEIDPIYTDPGAFYESLNVFPSLNSIETGITDCGNLTVPSGESAYNRFLSRLSENDAVVCMGEAVADDCETAQLVYNVTEDIQVNIYVAERSDGLCGVSFSGNEDHINLCSIESTMEGFAGISMSDSEWQEAFAEEPGETAAQVLTSGVQGEATTQFDCVIHQL